MYTSEERSKYFVSEFRLYDCEIRYEIGDFFIDSISLRRRLGFSTERVYGGVCLYKLYKTLGVLMCTLYLNNLKVQFLESFC